MAVIVAGMSNPTSTTSTTEISDGAGTVRLDGVHGFDFYEGRWTVHNRKLTNMLDPTCDDWIEFDAISECRITLGGLGNVDTFDVAEMPSAAPASPSPFAGMTLRLYDPARDVWSIWWASTNRPGRLDPPVEGRFVDGRGVFEGEDELDGTPIVVRFVWSEITRDTARWEQEFSFDGGATWVKNWVMVSERVGSAP